MQGGFHQQQNAFRPGGLTLVIALHAAALTALALAKGPEFLRPDGILTAYNVPIPPPPDPETPPPQPRVPQPHRAVQSHVDTTPPIADRFADTIGIVTTSPPPYVPPDTGNSRTETARADPPPPVRIGADFDPRFAGEVQPPYPPSELRAQRDGIVRIRVTIGTDGRVRAVQLLSATGDAFWRATERHVLAHWRFRPATLDGRPVETTRTMTLRFRIEDQA